jgi:hypothetical protein
VKENLVSTPARACQIGSGGFAGLNLLCNQELPPVRAMPSGLASVLLKWTRVVPECRRRA